ncbi:MAG: HDIG domain-containing metalloprotein [Candidatus Poribacteria bacterium]
MQMPWFRYKGIIARKRDNGSENFILGRIKLHWWLTGIAFVFIISWLIFPSEYRKQLVDMGDFKLGEKSSKSVFANVNFNYREAIESDAEKQQVIASVPPVFNLDFQGLKKVEEQFDIVSKARNDEILKKSEKIVQIKEQFYIEPSDNASFFLIMMPEEQLIKMKEETLRILSDVLSRGVIADSKDANFAQELSKIDYLKPRWDEIRSDIEKETGVTAADTQIAEKLSVTIVDNRIGSKREKTLSVQELMPWSEARMFAMDMANELPEHISDVVKEMAELMRPNLIYNPLLTKDYQEQKISEVLSASNKIAKDDKIIGNGDIVTESNIRKLKALSSAQRHTILNSLPSVILIVSLLTIILIVYLITQDQALFAETRKVLALGILVLLMVALGNLIINQVPKLGLKTPGFLVPVALVSVVIAIIANVQLAILTACIIGVFLAISAGIGTTASFEYFLISLTGGVTSAISASYARRRRHLIIPGLYVSATNVLAILGMELLTGRSPSELGTNCLVGGINGIIVALLTPGLLPVFEYISRTTTDMELLELSDLNQPLLAQLKDKASGSYYHSLDVAKLAETAAESIKASPLLARVGAYYHDIGKTTKPEFFIENQKGENVHDKLNPSMSSRIISAHVKDGVKIAKDARLPQVIQDIIQQHHGNTLIGGLRFYQKAMESDKHNTVRLEDYRYPGPKPQTRESAIVLLADSVESARHVLLRDDPSYSRLINFVREIIEDKTMDSQLDECSLTLRDVSLISDAFVKVFSGMYHTRIEYPKEAEPLPVGTENE